MRRSRASPTASTTRTEPKRGAVAFLLLGLPFLGRQQIRVTDQRVSIEEGFWTKRRDDIEIFRIRDVTVEQNLWQRLTGIGRIVIRSTEGRSEETHVLRGVKDPVGLAEIIRGAWNAVARPRGPSTNLD